jgi:LacI family transcriptional regulator
MSDRRIAALVSSEHYGRELLLGIARYARERGGWLLHAPGGAVAPITSDVAGLTVPVVNVSARLRATPHPRVTVDNLASGRVAAEHLIERGFKHLAFVSSDRHFYAESRHQGFVQRAREAGLAVSTFSQGTDREGWSWEGQQGALATWAGSLPRPAAIAACSDVRAQQVMDAIRACGLRSPEDIAVLGFDDDPLLCELSDPPLSSVATNFDQVGYVAASLLDRMMDGASVPPDTHLAVPPGRVTVRRSTDVFAVDDPEVAEAMRFIRARATQRVRVSDVLEAMPMSRRNLERRFVRVLGRTIFDDIRLAQLERAKQLLLQTDWPVYRVATEAGFNDSKHLALEFSKHLKQTPLAFRKAHRPDAPEHRGRR